MDATLKIPSVTGIDVELRVAGPGGRSYAFVIDWHIRVLAAAAWVFASAIGYFGIVGVVPPLEIAQADFAFVVVLPAVLLYVLYHPVLEVAMRGRTPGKRIAGVRIVRRDGGVPGIGPLLVRNLFRLIDSLPFFYCVGLLATLLTRHSVRVGDLAAGTLLVYDAPEAETSFDRLSGAGIERVGLAQAELIRDLLARWPELKPPVRVTLARRLLEGVGVARDDADETALRGELEALLR
jgi:uncharacterized RDD family membrane protein YckC